MTPAPAPPPAGAHELLLAQSSLQFMLAAALAVDARRRGGRSTLLFVPDVLEPALFTGVLDDPAATPFDAARVLRPRRRPGEPSASRGWRAVVDEVRAAVADAAPDALTVFNDRQDAAQAALTELSRRAPAALRRCAEDGALAYSAFRYRPHGALTRWRQRLRLGRGWHDVTVLGTHPLVQRYLALRPALLRPELRRRAVEPFPVDAFGSPALQSLASRLCAAAGTDVDTARDAGVLLTLSHSSYAARNPRYADAVRDCVAALVARRQPFAYKYHPRETDADPLQLAAAPGSRELTRVLPVECLYLLWAGRPVTVIGGLGTSLLTAALLMPAARVVALPQGATGADTWSPALIEELHIATGLPAGAASAS